MNHSEIIAEIKHETGLELIEVDDVRNIVLTNRFAAKYDLSPEMYENTFKSNLALFQLEGEKIVGIVLNNCELNAIPKCLFEISSLRVLSLASNRIGSLEYRFDRLQYLEYLDLSKNEIVEMPPSIYGLKNLVFLNLHKNQIAELSKDIRKLASLETLLLSENKLTRVPDDIIELDALWKYTERLNDINFEKNKAVRSQTYELAARLRDEERHLFHEGKTGINFDGNDIENLPPELVKNGRNKILEYWHSLSHGESLPVNEFKLILVGDGGSGKTSLLKRITTGEFDKNEKQTHGINIQSWRLKHGEKEVSANLWDFGGQEIMHSTHQFFLSNRSLYIVVIDSRREDKVEYWLKHIEALGGNSPTLIVINKIDENAGFDVNRKFLLKKYPNIFAITKVSCSTGEGLEALISSIKGALDKVSHLNTLWPKSWFLLKQRLETINENFISITTFHELCKELEIYSKSSQSTLLDFFHDLGVMLRFKDFGLNDTSVLNPHWVTEGVYRIINSKKLAEHLGILKYELLESILPKEIYPRQQHNFLVSLMEKFELCYKISTDAMLIPDLLSVQEPDFEIEPTLEFLFIYNFLPRSIFPRFVVRMKNDVKESLAWRTGVVLENKKMKSLARITIDYEEKRIYVKVAGESPRDYFSIIHHSLTDINSSFQFISTSERVPIGDEDLTVSYQHLKNLEEMGVFTFIPEGSLMPINVSATLGSITKTRKESIEEEILNSLREIKNQISDRGGLINEANKILELKPNIAGIGINVNALIDKLFKSK